MRFLPKRSSITEDAYGFFLAETILHARFNIYTELRNN